MVLAPDEAMSDASCKKSEVDDKTASYFIQTPFKVSIPQSKVDEMKSLIKLCPLPPPFYEGTDEKFGVTSEWMEKAKSHWLNSFSWSEYQTFANKYPQYISPVKSLDGRMYDIHYVSIPSSNPDAIPLLLIHGWPGSHIEFFPIAPYLKDFHVVIPSLPGFAFSQAPPVDKEFGFPDATFILNELMVQLKYPKYLVQGGDLGSFFGRLLGTKYSDNCKGVHFNLIFIADRPELPKVSTLDEFEQIGINHGLKYATNGTAYAVMLGTRPSTLAHVLCSSPIALLAFIGEKYIEWSDKPHITLEQILGVISLWWLTDTFATSAYNYREIFIDEWPSYWNRVLAGEEFHMSTPFGYSYFPKEIVPTPKAWAALTGNMVYFKRHTKGGHYAATEYPKELAQDIKAFAKIAWKSS